MMGTFIISFIGNSFVDSTQNWQLLGFIPPEKRRRPIVIVYFSLILALVTLCECHSDSGSSNASLRVAASRPAHVPNRHCRRCSLTG